MNNAIKLAIEKGGYMGGWQEWWEFEEHRNRNEWVLRHNADWDDFITFKEIALDPLFWQSLGKALGWADEVTSAGNRKEHAFPQYYRDETDKINKAWEKCIKQPEWLFHAREYFNLILTGGDTEKFWKGLLND